MFNIVRRICKESACGHDDISGDARRNSGVVMRDYLAAAIKESVPAGLFLNFLNLK